MRDVEITINRRAFRIACEEDQEKRLRALAKYVDREVQGLTGQVGQIGDDRLLVMVALLLADRLDEAAKNPDNVAPVTSAEPAVDDEETAEILSLLAERLESMAARLEKAVG